MKNYSKLSTLLHITFEDIDLINQAFVHRSYLNESKSELSSNERLEFLGDSVLSFLVSEYLYKAYPKLQEGELTNLRSSIVKTGTLAELSRKLKLGEYIFFSKGEEEGGGRDNTSILADTFEALLGAIYLDKGLSSVRKIIEENLLPMLSNILKNKSYKDSKSMFQEYVQEKTKFSPLYKVLEEKGPDHAKEFTIGVYVDDKKWGSGKGKSKQEAEQKAAEQAIEKWLKT